MTARKTRPTAVGKTSKTPKAIKAIKAIKTAGATSVGSAGSTGSTGRGRIAARPAKSARPGAAAAAIPGVMQPMAQYHVGRSAAAGMVRGARSAAMAAIHSAASDLHAGEVIDLVTLRQFDRACLSAQPIGPDDVRAIRQANHVSQTVFARCLGTSESTVKQWESGAKRPSGMARTLLNAVRKHGLAVLY